MTDTTHLLGLSCAFEYVLQYEAAEKVTAIALRLTHADMGAAAQQRDMPANYHAIVSKARAWLREAERVIEGDAPRHHDAALEKRMAVRKQAADLRASFNSYKRTVMVAAYGEPRQ
jgi:hypothetical protein